MSEVIQGEMLFFLISVSTGVLLLFGYDLLRALRSVFPQKGGLLSAFDFLYWCVAGIGAFCVIFQKNSGVLRGFSIIGILLGMMLYHKSISRLILKLFSVIIRTISTIFAGAIRVICLPVCLLSKKFRKITLKRLKNKGKEIRMYFNKH